MIKLYFKPTFLEIGSMPYRGAIRGNGRGFSLRKRAGQAG